jgi:hypothetical protein
MLRCRQADRQTAEHEVCDHTHGCVIVITRNLQCSFKRRGSDCSPRVGATAPWPRPRHTTAAMHDWRGLLGAGPVLNSGGTLKRRNRRCGHASSDGCSPSARPPCLPHRHTQHMRLCGPCRALPVLDLVPACLPHQRVDYARGLEWRGRGCDVASMNGLPTTAPLRLWLSQHDPSDPRNRVTCTAVLLLAAVLVDQSCKIWAPSVLGGIVLYTLGKCSYVQQVEYKSKSTGDRCTAPTCLPCRCRLSRRRGSPPRRPPVRTTASRRSSPLQRTMSDQPHPVSGLPRCCSTLTGMASGFGSRVGRGGFDSSACCTHRPRRQQNSMLLEGAAGSKAPFVASRRHDSNLQCWGQKCDRIPVRSD